MNRLTRAFCGFLLTVAAVGCGTSYQWRSPVPEKWRTVAVPTFRNETDLSEIGAISARQILRELQREGSFKVCSAGEAALEIQGTIKQVMAGNVAYNRRSGLRIGSYKMSMKAVVSVIDKLDGRVLIDNRSYAASTTFAGGQDTTTSERDASGRLADDLSRQVVDDVLAFPFDKEEAKR